MGFLSGRITFERFAVGGRDLQGFDQRHVEILERFAFGRFGAVTAEGIELGFTAGNHVLDLDFRLEKNIVNDALVFALRIDSNKIPNDLMKAYTELEAAALAANNPSGFPTKQQRREARQIAEERCLAEAQSGKFRKMRQYSALWDVRRNVIYFGATTTGAMEHFVSLFKEAFGRSLTRMTSGTIAHDAAVERDQRRAIEDLSPAVFFGPARSIAVSWVANQFGSLDFLGNEFLLWLWWVLDSQSDQIELPDHSTVTCMMNKTLTLECPLNETGKETIASEAPTRLPEAKRAALGGKLPRKTGLVLVRHDEQYELVLHAESLAVGSASLPKPTSETGRPESEDRVDQIRHLSQTLDLLFDAFCRRRLASAWHDDLRHIRSWLKEAE